jgi:hypothetical protein
VVQGGLVHQPADGVVDQQHAPDLLDHRLGGLGAQHHTKAPLVDLELIQGGLELPSLVVAGRQLGRGRLVGSRIVVSSQYGLGCWWRPGSLPRV